MRTAVIAAVLIALAPAASLSRSSHSGPAQPSTYSPLILSQAEGDRRLRRPRPEGAPRLAAASLIIKVDRENGGSPDFFMAYEEIQPGDAIPIHLHRNYDEILFVHRGSGVATLGRRDTPVAEGATIFIPPNTRVGLRNTGGEPLQVIYFFPRPEMVSAYYRELTVREGQPLKPFTAAEFAAFRARHSGHIIFE
jgi:mannose-6-phosphate isomerase-like protein (cupin superfamily)